MFIFCILYYLIKIEKYGNVVEIEDSQIRQINNETTSILNSHKFYSIIERDNIVSGAQSKEEIQNLLSSFDNDIPITIRGRKCIALILVVGQKDQLPFFSAHTKI